VAPQQLLNGVNHSCGRGTVTPMLACCAAATVQRYSRVPARNASMSAFSSASGSSIADTIRSI
jgi:hypothetical protein